MKKLNVKNNVFEYLQKVATFGNKLVRRFRLRKTIVFIGAIAGLFIFHYAPLPIMDRHTPLSKVLLAQDGELLAAKIASDQQWRFPRSERLPYKYIISVTEFEDKYFSFHPGINPFSIARALWGNIHAGKVTSGGSTITMQLARLLRSDPPRSYTNKFIEIYFALKLEWHYSKKEILSLYASEAPFGGNTVGIGAASWRYFGRYLHNQEGSSEELALSQFSWAEAALLAVLPNSPALIHPGRARGKLKTKRDRLLTRLFQKNYMSKNEYELSVLEPLPEKPKPLPRLAPHLLHTLSDKNKHLDTLRSTIDAELQQKLLKIAQFRGNELAKTGVHNLSIVVIDNQKMETVAYIGNVTNASNRMQYGADIDIAVRQRSTGSILKPLLYGLMLQSGDILPNTLVADVPSSFRGFTPENYDHQYRGAVPAKEALSRSLNIPAVWMLKKYGVARFLDDLKHLGMSTLFRSADGYGLSLILGGAEGSLWELTGIYAQLMDSARGREGSALKPVQILRGKKHQQIAGSTLGQGAAWLTLEALKEVKRPGNERRWREFSSSQHIAWKTGTSYGLRDAWAIGSNAKYTVGVWSGNAGGEGVSGLSGLNAAAPTLFEVFDMLGHSRWIERPVKALKRVETCKDDGYLAGGRCESEVSLAPRESHFQEVTPFHTRVHLDKKAQFRVHGGCERVVNMEAKSWLVLPPLQEYYWRKYHSEFKQLPPWREDCIAGLANYSKEMPMDIIYPLSGSKVYIPRELSGRKGRVVFQASHRESSARLFWHIDNTFVKETSMFHSVAMDLAAGWHKLIIVDELGFRLERWFKVLDKSSA